MALPGKVSLRRRPGKLAAGQHRTVSAPVLDDSFVWLAEMKPDQLS
jgi:hypothetical protein